MRAAKMISSIPHNPTLAATVLFDDEIEPLKQLGVDYVFNIYDEAGTGFSDHVLLQVDK